MIKNKWFDIAITICGAWDYDIARHFSNYKEDLFTTDDGELKDRHNQRLGNIVLMESYSHSDEEMQ